MRLTFVLWLLLLCSCATQRQAEKYFDENTGKLAEYADKNVAYTQQYGKAYAAKHFPQKLYAPAIYVSQPMVPNRLNLVPLQERRAVAPAAPGPARYPDYKIAYRTQTVYLPDTVRIDSLHRELEIEQLTNQAFRKQLKVTEADRDYWLQKNRQKFWTLIAMAVFGFLYILFKVLASRVRDS